MVVCCRINLVILFLFALCGASSVTPSYAQFFTGVMILNQRTVSSENDKAEQFRELQVLTGVSTEQALTYLGKIRDNHQLWKQMQDSINQIILDIEK